jgi:hypothetical protein
MTAQPNAGIIPGTIARLVYTPALLGGAELDGTGGSVGDDNAVQLNTRCKTQRAQSMKQDGGSLGCSRRSTLDRT